MGRTHWLRRCGWAGAALGLIWLGGLIAPGLVLAGCPNLINGYHYAGQHTSHFERLVSTCNLPDLYYGWNGVNGQLQVPLTQTSLHDYTTDHAAGYLGAEFSPGGYWLQIGWFTGTIADSEDNCAVPPPLPEHCVRRNGSYGWYAERNAVSGPIDTRYKVKDYGTAGLGALTTSRVVYSASSGCWESYLTYSGPKKLTDCTEPISGAMYASGETLSSGSPWAVDLPHTQFGTSNPNTNQALRLHGANGWEPWDTILVAQHTESRDERNAMCVPSCAYVKNDFNAHYFFEAYHDP